MNYTGSFKHDENKKVNKMNEHDLKDINVWLFLKGMLMGIADLIPGISGGTIALIVGIYDELIYSFAELFSNIHRLFSFIKKRPFIFLLVLYSGVFTSFVVFSKFVKFLLAVYALQTFAFFTGLVFASAILIFKRVKKPTFTYIFYLTLGLLSGYFISGLSAVLPHNLWVTFFSGFVAICAMILPGISGAFVLTMLGQYRYMIDALTSFNLIVLSVFTVGILLGLFVMSKFLKWLLKKYPNSTLYFLIGLMIGGTRNLIAYSKTNISLFSVFLVIGFLTVLVLEYYARRIAKKYKRKNHLRKIAE